ncbi:hypothetical protein GPLA_4265 [Paraglaciecola polaris LMG 21857]|uniref:Uncharacterized protein n=1 Tax=Paraglaciecola polaris LMG 21857 TaxID=1129793 RepID=K6YQY7_9ALTE|nr:hypothetical protein GPLA_4265 [Paraglaciecola polaris LMG 21857]
MRNKKRNTSFKRKSKNLYLEFTRQQQKMKSKFVTSNVKQKAVIS